MIRKTAFALALMGLMAAPAMADPLATLANTFDFADLSTEVGHYISAEGQPMAVGIGDPYDAEYLGQNTASAFFLTSVGGGGALHGTPLSMGTHVVTAAGVTVESFEFPGGPGELVVQVLISTDDSSDLLPAGIDGGGGDIINQMRMDVGAGTAPTQLDPTPDDFDVISADLFLFIDGGAAFSTALNPTAVIGQTTAGLTGQNTLGNVSVITGASGAGVDGYLYQYVITPEPGTLVLLGFGSLFLVSRRRKA